MSHRQLYEADAIDYSGSSFQRSTPITSSKRRRPTHGRRRGKAPQSFNGIHRRRKRKIAW
jgi:hypothetical protein